MRKNCEATKGDWRVMSAPEFEGVNKAGAPVSQYMGIIEKVTILIPNCSV